jgi:HEAT repeat protein
MRSVVFLSLGVASFLSTIPAMGEAPADPDVALLVRANCPRDDEGLLRFFQPPPPPESVDAAPLIRRLGADAFEEREAAARQLVTMGESALPQLCEACASHDPEIARRAAECRDAIEDRRKMRTRPDVVMAAVRLLAKQHPPGATAALLEYLPRAETAEVEEEIWYALDAIATAKIEPALVAALCEKEPERRAVATCLLGRLGNDEQKRAVRRLLKDADANVRLRAAQGLLAGKDAAGVPVLVDLLADSPLDVAWQAEELLHWLAGYAAPREVVGSGDMRTRSNCRAAWRQWLAAHPTQADPVAALASTRRPGLVLARQVLAKRFDEPVRFHPNIQWMVYGCDGTPRMNLGVSRSVRNLTWLRGGRLLVLRPGEVGECDLSNATVWDAGLGGDNLTAIRNSNGTTAVFTGAEIVEINPRGEIVRRQPQTVSWPRISAHGADGRLYGLDIESDYQTAHVLRMDLETGDVIALCTLPNTPRWWREGGCVQRLRDGFLVTNATGVVFEVDESGALRWVKEMPGVYCATALRDDRLLLVNQAGLVELDRDGRVCWEGFPRWEGRPQPETEPEIRPILGLVRLGFPPHGRDITADFGHQLEDLGSPVTEVRLRALKRFQQRKEWAADALPRLLPLLRDADPDVRITAAEVMATLGPRAWPAVPALIDLLADEAKARGAAGEALRQIGPRALPALKKALARDPRILVRMLAAWVVSEMEEEGDGAMPELRDACRDENDLVRTAAHRALERRDKAAAEREKVKAAAEESWEEGERLGRLVELLTDEGPASRSRAMRELGKMGPAARDATPMLLQGLTDRVLDPTEAVRTLGRIRATDPAVAVELLRILKDDKQERGLRGAAAVALGRLGPNGKDAVPLLTQLYLNGTDREYVDLNSPVPLDSCVSQWEKMEAHLRGYDGSSEVGYCSLVALTEQAAYSADVPALLLRICAERTATIGDRWVAAAGLRTVGAAHADLLPGIVALAKDEQVPVIVRLNLIEALGNMGPAAKEAAPLLRSMAEEGDRPVRKVAREALAKVAP